MQCGLHCINALLQGPYFNEVSMSQVALALDQKERDLMAESGYSSTDYLKYMQVINSLVVKLFVHQEGSSNVADDGNYSIQVLQKALKNYGDYQCVPIANPEVR